MGGEGEGGKVGGREGGREGGRKGKRNKQGREVRVENGGWSGNITESKQRRENARKREGIDTWRRTLGKEDKNATRSWMTKLSGERRRDHLPPPWGRAGGCWLGCCVTLIDAR